MKIYEIFLIGIALAMDAFALTIANCTTYKNNLTKNKEWAMPITFALFQFLMPIIGYYIGTLFSDTLSKIAGYLTAGIFFVLSAKIIYDIIREQKKEETDTFSVSSFNILTLLIQGLATSIDALFIGVTFAVKLSFSVFIASAIIGIVTFLLVIVALFIGKRLGKLLGKYATYLGAIILFALAIKNLIQAI